MSRPGRDVAGTAQGIALAVAAVLLPLAAGAGLALALGPTLHTKTFPWVTSRALGIAAYLTLTALVGAGLWFRHPWRVRSRLGHAETALRVHATLGAATVGLVVAHLAFLATDPWAGVGWAGALVPGLSHYRHVGVALGVVSFYALVAIGLTARFAGSPGARNWRAVHRLALPAFALAWLHGVLSGADAASLRPMYVATGGIVAVLWASRLAIGPPVPPPLAEPASEASESAGTRS